MTPFPFSFSSAPSISTMNHFNLMTLSLVLMISSYGAWGAPANADSELKLLSSGNISLTGQFPLQIQ
jgi:hypothetical protein